MPDASASPRRRTERAAETRAAVIAAARVAFADRGFADTTLRAIAERLDMTKGAVLHHFTSKTALFHAAYSECIHEIMRDTQQATITASGGSALRTSAWVFIEAVARPEHAVIVTQWAPLVLGPKRFDVILASWDTLSSAARCMGKKAAPGVARAWLAGLLELARRVAEGSERGKPLRRAVDAWCALLEPSSEEVGKPRKKKKKRDQMAAMPEEAATLEPKNAPE